MTPSDLREIRQALGQKSPLALLIWLQIAMFISFASWQVLIQNFAHEVVGFNGGDYGLLQSLREVPGFLAFLVVFVIMIIAEQWLAYLALLLLGFAVAVTGLLHNYWD